mgnify:CR=1 FL=1
MEYLSLLGLNVFRTAVELGTFRAAADHLKISQPAVSDHIHRIERYLGVKLFVVPYSRKLRLTEAGRILYRYAVDISALNNEILSSLDLINKGEMGDVRFAICTCKYLMSSFVASYAKRFPNINIIFRTCSSAHGKELLKHGEIDIGFFLPPNDSHLISIPLYKEPMDIICAADHPLTRKKIIDKETLAAYDFVTCVDGADYNRIVNTYLNRVGIYSVKKSIQVEDSIMILRVVEEGGGIGLLSRSTVQKSLDEGNIVSLAVQDELKPPNLELNLFVRKNTKLNRATQAFLNYIYEEITLNHPYITITNIKEHINRLKLKEC